MGPAKLERVVMRTVPEWTTRRLQLLYADFVNGPAEFLDESKTEGVISRRTAGFQVADFILRGLWDDATIPHSQRKLRYGRKRYSAGFRRH